MFIIITDKPGEYSSELDANVQPVESWKYIFYGKQQATFTIGEVTSEDARIKIIDAQDASCVNSVPSKFFGDFSDIEAARAEINELIHFSDIDARLEKV